VNNEKGKVKKEIHISYHSSLYTFLFSLLFFHSSLFTCFGQVASRTDGVNVFYYDSIFEAVAASDGTFEQPDEITLLADIILDEPLIVDDGVHIRLVPGTLGFSGSPDRTIRRSGNLIKFPVIWLNGDSASLSLGKPGMGRTRTEPLSGVASTMRGSPLHELVIDGGRFNNPPVEAHAPLVAVNGLGSKLTMYDKVTLQNNKNSGTASRDSYYENGGGVAVWTRESVADNYTDFIMKGGTIRGNISNAQFPCGGGVLMRRDGNFTMEGGAVMNNTAGQSGGGLYIFGNGTFKKTGGIIYGSNAPAAYRNTALVGLGTPPGYGHAVAVAYLLQTILWYRDDTVKENNNLTFQRRTNGNVVIGKWNTPEKALLRLLLAVVLPFLALVVCVFLIFRKRTLKLAKIIQEAADTVPEIDLENMGLSEGEKDLCELLLSNSNLKEIAAILKLSYPGATHRARKLYAKLGIKGRTELLVRVKKNEQ
jgi:DNA-binding CsgD family transcriptional regulator